MSASAIVIADAIFPAQVRAGRALLGWTQEELSTASGVPKRTIARIELADGTPRATTLAPIRAALEAAGVEFTDGAAPGVRLRCPNR